MSLTNVDELQLFFGKPLVFEDICMIYSPTLRDIMEIGSRKFFHYIGLLTVNMQDISKEKVDISEIMYLIATSLLDEEFFQTLRQAFTFFTKEEIVLLPELECIQIGSLEEQRIFTKTNFLSFQKYIKAICALDRSLLEEKESDNVFVKAIREKIEKGQALVAKIKGQNTESSTLELTDLISSFLAKATEVDMSTILDMPYYAFQIQFRRMQMIEEYDVNIRSALAGAKIPQDELKHWIRKIQDK